MKGKKEEQLDTDNLGISFMFDLPAPIVITHGDVDGLCAAGMVVKEYKRNGTNASVFITQPFSLHSVLNDIRKNGLKGSLIIVDLALTEKSVKYKDKEGNEHCRIPSGSIIIDHHPSSLEFRKYLRDNGIYYKIVTKYSASQIVGEMVPSNKTNDYMARLGGVGDWKIIDKKLGEESMKLSAAMSWKHRDDDFRLEIMKGLIIITFYLPAEYDIHNYFERGSLHLDSCVNNQRRIWVDRFSSLNYLLLWQS